MNVARSLMPWAALALTSEHTAHGTAFLHDLPRRVRGEQPRVVLFHDPADPQSHLLLLGLDRHAAELAITIEVRVVDAVAPDSRPDPDRWGSWALSDATLVAPAWGLSFRPTRFPEPGRVATARRILAGTTAAADAIAVGDALWEGAPLGPIGARIGLPGEDAAEAAFAEHAALRARRGHYGTGVAWFAGHCYEGIARLPHLAHDIRRVTGDPGPELAPDPSRLTLPPSGDGGIELFFSFRSPYSALALERAWALADAAGRTVVVRPVPPMVRRGLKVPLAKRMYMVRDAAREARRLGEPFGRICDPLPAWRRGAALWWAGRRTGDEREALRAWTRGVWSEGVDALTDRGLRRLASTAGVPWSDVHHALDDPTVDAAMTRNAGALGDHELWGVPSFVAGQLVFWGQDHLWLLAEALRD